MVAFTQSQGETIDMTQEHEATITIIINIPIIRSISARILKPSLHVTQTMPDHDQTTQHNGSHFRGNRKPDSLSHHFRGHRLHHYTTAQQMTSSVILSLQLTCTPLSLCF
jgi:hypothetical protein